MIDTAVPLIDYERTTVNHIIRDFRTHPKLNSRVTLLLEHKQESVWSLQAQVWMFNSVMAAHENNKKRNETNSEHTAAIGTYIQQPNAGKLSL